MQSTTIDVDGGPFDVADVIGATAQPVNERPARPLSPQQMFAVAILRHALRDLRLWCVDHDIELRPVAVAAKHWLDGGQGAFTVENCCELLNVRHETLLRYVAAIPGAGALR